MVAIPSPAEGELGEGAVVEWQGGCQVDEHLVKMRTKVGHADFLQMAPGMEGGPLRSRTCRLSGRQDVPECLTDQPKDVRALSSHFAFLQRILFYTVVYIWIPFCEN